MVKVLFTTISEYGDCSASESDDPNLTSLDQRLENRQRVSDKLELNSMAHLITPIPAPKEQSIVVIDDPIKDLDLRPHAECVITQNPDLAVGVFAADCLQVLFADEAETTVAAIHLSRENLSGEFLEEAIGKIRDIAQSDVLHAHLGPCLQRNNHRLGSDYGDSFSKQAQGSEAFLTAVDDGDVYLFDYRGYALQRLGQSGVIIKEQLDIDTLDSSDHFSARGHRFHGQPRGTNLAAIRLGH